MSGFFAATRRRGHWGSIHPTRAPPTQRNDSPAATMPCSAPARPSPPPLPCSPSPRFPQRPELAAAAALHLALFRVGGGCGAECDREADASRSRRAARMGAGRRRGRRRRTRSRHSTPFGFVTDSPSSRSAIQLQAVPAEDGNVGQMLYVMPQASLSLLVLHPFH
jgi:hypothetical protein